MTTAKNIDLGASAAVSLGATPRGDEGGHPGHAPDEQGRLKTRDLVSIAPGGRIQLTDRSKAVIKSGGKWISLIALETVALGHPGVMQAAVIAVPHAQQE